MKYWFGLIFLSLFMSCQSDVVFEDNTPINTFNWSILDTLKYEIDIQDTASKYDLSLNIRHRDIYEYTNLYVKVITIMPSGEKKSDIVSLPLCDESGKWLGKCSGDICYQKVFLMKKLLFPTKGIYRFYINQEMRQDKLKNILDIGLKLVHSKKKQYHEGEE